MTRSLTTFPWPPAPGDATHLAWGLTVGAGSKISNGVKVARQSYENRRDADVVGQGREQTTHQDTENFRSVSGHTTVYRSLSVDLKAARKSPHLWAMLNDA